MIFSKSDTVWMITADHPYDSGASLLEIVTDKDKIVERLDAQKAAHPHMSVQVTDIVFWV